MHIVWQVLYVALTIYEGLLWTRFIVDWVQVFARSWTPRGVLLVLLEVVYSSTDPPINALRRFIPPLRLGGIVLDLSFLILLVAVILLRGVAHNHA